ncbi:MAG: serine protease [Rubrivivax sp.]|nr:serine protease [Rubrivivax sp.]
MSSPHWSRRAWLAALAGVAFSARADLPSLISTLRPSVLPVGTYSALSSPRFTFRGSGFVVEGGSLLITNAHVLPDPGTTPAPQLAVLAARADGGRDVRVATLVGVDRAHDLALLRLEGAPLPALELAENGTVREGMDVALMGYPIGGVLGYSVVTHRGIVSSVTAIALPSPTSQQLTGKSISRLREGPFEVYQLDATAYPGNSGGPLLDAHTGRVVGIVNMVLVRSTRESALSNPTGITYAIPVRFARDLMKDR